MIDIHNHIIYDVDDGPSTIDDSIRMILEAHKIGVKAIVTTPHYHKDLYKSDQILDKILNNFNDIKWRIRDFGIDLYLGYEVFLDTNTTSLDLLNARDNLTLNDTKNLLFELPFNNFPLNLDNMIHTLHREKIVPIMAHPERYKFFLRNEQKFLDLIEAGCLIQIDAGSIVGAHGSAVKKFTKKCIELNLVQFVASDAHIPGHYTQWYKKAYEVVKNWAGKEYCEKIFYYNQNYILSNTLLKT